MQDLRRTRATRKQFDVSSPTETNTVKIVVCQLREPRSRNGIDLTAVEQQPGIRPDGVFPC